MNQIQALLNTAKGLNKFNDKQKCLEWYGHSLEKVVHPLNIRLWVKPNWPAVSSSTEAYRRFTFSGEEAETLFYNWDEILPKTMANNFMEVNREVVASDSQFSTNKTVMLFKIGQWGILEILGNHNNLNRAIFSVIDWLNNSLNERILLISKPEYKKAGTLSTKKTKQDPPFDFACIEIDTITKSIVSFISPGTSLLKFSTDQLTGHPFTELFIDNLEAESIFNYIKEYGSLNNYPVKLKEKNNQELLFQFHGTLDNEKIIGFFSTANSQGQGNRKPTPLVSTGQEDQTEEVNRYKQIILEWPNPALLLNAQRAIVLSNEQFSMMSGYKAVEIKDTKPSFLLPEESGKEQLVSEIRDTLIAGQEWHGEVQIKTKNEQLIWNYVHLKPIRNLKGEISNYVVTFENINERKHLEQILTKARIEAEMASDAKTQFLSMMSHELRNPLSAIVGNIELLETLKVDPTTRNTINRLKISSENLKAIIDDILDFSKIEADQIILENAPFDLYAICNNIIASWQPKAEQKRLKLGLEFDPKIKPSVLGDEKRLTQVINNLISNAIKFTDSGFVMLRCSLISSKNKFQRIKFTVEDSGIGIAPDRIDKIFNRFIQESAATNRQYGGTGLGLAISKELVDKMGGQLSVESIKNVGSKFYFELPLNQSSLKVSPKKTNLSDAVSTERLKGKTILMVDDAVFNLQTFTPMIEKWGIRCLTAEDGDLAIEKIKQNGATIDLILMDLRMPNMNGIEATKLIREQGWQGPIIAMTGEALKETIDECMEAGMNDYVTKPFKSAELRQKLIKYLAGEPAENIQQATNLNKPIEMDKKLYDLAGLSNLYDNDQDSIKASVKSFTELMPETLGLLRQNFESQQWKQFSDAAHKLKTPVRLMRVADLGDVLQQLEDFTKNGTTNDKVAPLFEKVETTLKRALEQMADDLKKDS